MPPDPEFTRLFQAEKLADVERAQACRREAERCAGVAWSGLAPDPFCRRGAADLARNAGARLTALQAWRSSSPGRLLAAMTAAERAVEAVRACIARGLAADDRRCALAIGELERAARSAMDAVGPAILFDGLCATSTASSSPSTASSTNSAS